MHYRSHKWIDIPHTAYERKRELRVRESMHTVILFDKKYQNIDTGKFDTDRLETIQSCTLGDALDNSINYYPHYKKQEDNSPELEFIPKLDSEKHRIAAEKIEQKAAYEPVIQKKARPRPTHGISYGEPYYDKIEDNREKIVIIGNDGLTKTGYISKNSWNKK